MKEQTTDWKEERTDKQWMSGWEKECREKGMDKRTVNEKSKERMTQ